jgi:hypothetical protein
MDSAPQMMTHSLRNDSFQRVSIEAAEDDSNETSRWYVTQSAQNGSLAHVIDFYCGQPQFKAP